MNDKPRQNSSRKLLLSTGFSLLLIAGVASWRSYINAEPQFAIPPAAKLPKPNGFDVYVRAAQMIVAANPAVDSVNDPNQPTDAKVRAQKYSLQNKNAWLRLNAPAFATFQKALTLPCRHASMRADDDLFGSYGKLRELARCKSIERKAREMSGDWNGAVQSQIDTVQMGTDIGRGGVIISGLVAIAIGAIGRDHPWANVEKLNALKLVPPPHG
jgi:hypothetical protein